MSEHRQWQQHLGLLIDTKDGFDIIDCSACGFRHIVPIPTDEELENIYRNEYYSIEKPMCLEGIARDLSWWNLVFQDRYEEFERLLPPGRRRLLDVGAGSGFFLQHGQQQGWDVNGIEPSKEAATHARNLGLDIYEGMLDKTSAKNLGPYDVVHLNNVMEHIPDPTEMLNICHDLLDPDGILCVGVPNDYSPFQQALHKTCGYEPWWVTTPYHINYFNLDSLHSIMERNGF
ncbi:class I SAM-dependent methyltransferase [Desulfuromonas sp. CSMB_57]|uniref:class I SAM-dependent methyltransferase n=1 Tax=Desulfuromonas sp. CSMB_57 TaxID=2807629 RepID=UPI001CD64CA8|nr:class I SAM-dependent methyltransferase [Desulfuromonas sp. CSMB_57]